MAPRAWATIALVVTVVAAAVLTWRLAWEPSKDDVFTSVGDDPRILVYHGNVKWAAQFAGLTLVQDPDDNCLQAQTADGERTPVAWPAGSSPFAQGERRGVDVAGGGLLLVGEVFGGGGGASSREMWADTEALDACVPAAGTFLVVHKVVPKASATG